MTGLDTNVLVRFLVRDDEGQFERARRLIRREAAAGEPVLINLLVMLETERVLRSRYNLTKAEILIAFSGLLSRLRFRLKMKPRSSRRCSYGKTQTCNLRTV